MVAMLECYLCNTSLKDIPEHEDEWEFRNVDGANVPLCWGCGEKMDEYIQDAMAESRGEEEW